MIAARVPFPYHGQHIVASSNRSATSGDSPLKMMVFNNVKIFVALLILVALLEVGSGLERCI